MLNKNNVVNKIYKMNRSAILAITLCAFFFGANAWCAPWNEGGVVNFCRQANKTNCVSMQSDDFCWPGLNGGTYLSGYTGGSYACTLFHLARCSDYEGAFKVNRDGWDMFPYRVESFVCPCVPRWWEKN